MGVETQAISFVANSNLKSLKSRMVPKGTNGTNWNHQLPYSLRDKSDVLCCSKKASCASLLSGRIRFAYFEKGTDILPSEVRQEKEILEKTGVAHRF